MPQLDTLRCFAVLGVLVSHLWWQSPLPWIFAPLSWGHMGVQLFFVLSGFLITGILLDGRRRVDAGETTPRFFARQFYARRFLRIFPVYYLTLVVLVALDFGRVRDFAPILFGYVSNLYVSVTGEWIGHFSHLWSLAVEEQFYVVWPFLILLLPRRMFLPLLLVVILLAPATRAAIVSVVSLDDLERGGWAEPTAFTTSSLDCLGLGALLAVVGQRGGRRAVTRLGAIVLPLGL
jgi:peptidoglycan/LPS O-acetylase OafA/YrhL